jgi:hypothetical protein
MSLFELAIMGIEVYLTMVRMQLAYLSTSTILIKSCETGKILCWNTWCKMFQNEAVCISWVADNQYLEKEKIFCYPTILNIVSNSVVAVNVRKFQ